VTITYSENSKNANDKIRWTRNDVSQKIVDFETRNPIFSQRDFAKETGVPRTTLQNWVNRKAQIDADPELVDFLESPVGVKFLHHLTLALHFEFTKVGCAGIRNFEKGSPVAGKRKRKHELL